MCSIKQLVLTAIVLLLLTQLSAQDKKVYTTNRIDEVITIDGLLNESVWKHASVATDFITRDPVFGFASRFKTEVRLAYDDRAIYVAAVLHDPRPDSIFTELTQRDDQNANVDVFSLELNPYNDGQNSYFFWVTAANVQCDIKSSITDDDTGWNVVWESEISFNENGWIVEMRLPYSELRIPKIEEQTWGVNFWRHVRRERQWSCWNPVDKEIEDVMSREGLLKGIANIDPPLRLSLYPYVSSSVQYNEESSEPSYSINGGLDLKYGIDESYTLDMTLIPDFGQIKSDEEVLNLSPFEVRYDENRSFFTEGTELFNRAGLFYSRRIGKRPAGYHDVSNQLNEGEHIVENPLEAKLINATKISGRNTKNLGLGFFNAITDNTYAQVADENGNKRTVLSEPLTNYNIIVADQAFKNSSYINLINTNMYQPSNGGIANVTGTAMRFMDKNNRFGFVANGAVSYRDGLSDEREVGEQLDFEVGKLNGNWIYSYQFNMISEDYNPNDMGFLYHNNQLNHGWFIEHRKFEPFWKLLNISNRMYIGYDQLYASGAFTELSAFYRINMTTKKFLSMGGNFNTDPLGNHDYYEPRMAGRYYRGVPDYSTNVWVSSDYRKTLALDMNGGFYNTANEEHGYWYSISPRLRLSDKVFLVYRFNLETSYTDEGFANIEEDDDIIFGIRDTKTVINTLFASYVFNNKSSLTLNLRHYWRNVDVLDFKLLKQDGTLEEYDYSGDDAYTESSFDTNFNVFTIDLVYSWNLAPGSFFNVVWKNYISPDSNSDVDLNFMANLQNTFDASQINSLSVKLIYYLNYQDFVKHKK